MATIIARLWIEDNPELICKCSSSHFTKHDLINEVNNAIPIVRGNNDEFVTYLKDNGYNGSYEKFYEYGYDTVYDRLEAVLSLNSIEMELFEHDVIGQIWDWWSFEDEL